MVAEAPKKLADNVVELPPLMVVFATVNEAIVAGGTVVVVVGANRQRRGVADATSCERRVGQFVLLAGV